MDKKLKWGETPWDDLSKAQLLREVQRMFAALEAAWSVLGIMKVQANENDPFWSERGSGGRALDRASQVIEPVYEAYDDESVYRSFFRYASPLLFEVADEEKWIICPVCGSMWGGKHALTFVGAPCSEHPMAQNSQCTGIFRMLQWEDLAKK